MTYTFSFALLLGVYGFCNAQNLRSLDTRLNILEMQILRDSLRTRTDIMQLKKDVSFINSTASLGGGQTVDNTAVETKLNKLDMKLENFMHDQHKTSIALAKALTEEKAMTRKMLKIIQDLTDSNAESVIEIEQALEQSENEREAFKKNWKIFEDKITSELSAMSNSTNILHDKFENFDGNIIIRNVEKTDPCPKSWLQDENTCYFYQKQEKLSWYGARIRCHDFGGKLAEPDTEEKMFYVLLTVDGDNIWIGATDQDQEGKWVWASSQKQLGSYVIWQPNQPNNVYGNQHCMEIGLLAVNDESCMEENYYICEKPVAV